MATDEQDQEFVEFILKTIVENPDDVKVDRTIDEMGVLLSVTVNPSDMGKVIGKSGQTAKAIRTLLKVVGAKHDARVNMKIIEPEGGEMKREIGTTTGADEIPESATSTEEAAEDQQQTSAAVQQPSENDAAVDEATGQDVPEEPVTETPVPEQPAEPAEEAAPKDPMLNEKSPLDEL